MIRKLLYVTLFVIMAIGIVACGNSDKQNNKAAETSSPAPAATEKPAESAAPAPAAVEKVSLNLTSGSPTGLFYPLGASMAKLWSDNIEGMTVASQASNGSVNNINLLQQKEASIGLTGVGQLLEAYHGEGQFKGRAYTDARVISALYPISLQVIVRDGAGESFRDLKGKSIVPGAPGSASESDTKKIVEAYGLTYDDFKTSFVGYAEATAMIKNKQADAAQCSCALNTSAVSEMLTTANSHLISLDDAEIQKIVEKYPYWYPYSIPANSYDKQDKEIKTVGSANMLFADKTMSDEVAYNLAKALWEHKADLESTATVMKAVKVEDAVVGLADLPLHPGAEKYYKEIGVLK